MMREKLDGLRVRMLSNPWIVALLFLAFLRPNDIVNPNVVLSWAMVAYKGVAMLLIAFCFLVRPYLSLATVVLGVYQVLLAVCTVLNGNTGLSGWIYAAASIGAVCLLADEAATTDPKALVKGLACCLGALCVINLATVLLFPNGMRYMDNSERYANLDCYFFLGMDNSHAFFIVPALVVSVLYAQSVRWPFIAQAGLLALFTVSVYITWPASGVVAVSVFIVLFLLYRVRKSYRLCNVCTYYGAIAALFVVLVLLRMTQWLAPVIEDVLHKNLSLSGRVPLWEKVMVWIREKPLLGYGKLSSDATEQMVGQVNCHNIFLQVVMDTGLAGLAVYVVFLGLLIRPLWRVRQRFAGFMLAAGLFSFLLILQVESLVWPLPFYTLALLCYHAPAVADALETGASAPGPDPAP